EVLQRHVEQHADAARERLQEPDVGDRCSELDMPHALATDARESDFDTALLADDALVLHPLVLAAQALIVLDRAEDAGAEKPVPLRLEGAVVDRLRLFDLAIGPGQDLVRAGDGNTDLIKDLRRRLRRIEDIRDLLIHSTVSFDAAGRVSQLPAGTACKSFGFGVPSRLLCRFRRRHAWRGRTRL